MAATHPKKRALALRQTFRSVLIPPGLVLLLAILPPAGPASTVPTSSDTSKALPPVAEAQPQERDHRAADARLVDAFQVQRQLDQLHLQIETIADAVKANPDTVLVAPLFKRDIDHLRERVGEISDFTRWFFVIMATQALTLAGLALTVFFSLRQKRGKLKRSRLRYRSVHRRHRPQSIRSPRNNRNH
jgi:hypothetical protein